MPAPRFVVLLAAAAGLLAAPGPQEPEDPVLRTAVEQFFKTQQDEDVDGYLALWSAGARRPGREMLQYIFDAGDDVFSEIQIIKAARFGDRVRVRVAAVRQRTERPRVQGLPPRTRRIPMLVSLTFVRAGAEWKLLREGPASDDLAHALIEARTPADRSALMAGDPDLLDGRLLQSMARIAGDFAQQGMHAAAQAAYERILEVARHIKDRKHEGEALQNLGNAHYFQRRLPEALAAYEARLAIERERGDDAGIAAALSGIATIRYAFAEYSQALSAYRDALAIQERLGDEALIATSLISTGNVRYLQGDFDAAIADYSRSRDLNRKILNTLGEARALEGLGRVFLARGDLAGALDAFTGVLQEAAARGNRAAQGNATLSLGEVHYRLGNLGTARTTFEASRGHFEAAGDAANVGRVWQAIALTDLVASRFALAEQEYAKSRTICGEAGDMECAAGASAGLGFAQTAQEKYPEGIASYRQAIDGFRRLNRREQVARTQISLADALSGSGDHDGAIEAAVDARQSGTFLENDDIVWRALVAEAQALRALDRAEPALATARAALRALETLVEAARMRPASPVPRESASVFATLAILHTERGDATAAFEAIEQMRVHDLRLGLASAEREIARGMTPEEREEERAIAVELVTLHAQLGREKGLPKPDRERIERLERTLVTASERRAKQQERLFARLPELRTWRGLMSPAAPSDLASVLADGDALLQLVMDDRDVLVLTALRTEDGIEWTAQVRPVTRTQIAERVARLMQLDVLRSLPDWRRASNEFLSPMIPQDALEVLKDARRLVVIPHDVLWRVPFEALSINDRYLGELTAVSYAPSVTALVRVPPAAVSAGPSRILTAAAPEIPDSVRTKLQQLAPGWTLRDPGSALNEVKVVAGDAPAEQVIALSGAAATERALRLQLGEADLIHLAVPFRINGASPLFSPLLLTGEPSGPLPDAGDDGRLDAREIMNVNMRAGVAVLSDGSALTMREAADDAVWVYWAWRAAGVHGLIVPRWPVGAETSDLLLEALHGRLRAGEDPGEALRRSQAAVRRPGARAAPYYWAGWLLIGG